MSHFYSTSYHDANDLALDLGEALQGKRNPFQQQIVVVQSQGMGKWLKLRIADQCGICGVIKFSFPKAFITFDMDKVQFFIS